MVLKAMSNFPSGCILLGSKQTDSSSVLASMEEIILEISVYTG